MGFELGTVVGTSVGRDDGIKVGVNEGELLGMLVGDDDGVLLTGCLLYTSPSPRDGLLSRMPSSA